VKDDTLTTGALFLGGGVAGYTLGRWVIARWLDPRPATTTAPTTAPPTANVSTPAIAAPPATPPPATAPPAVPAATTPGSTAPSVVVPEQARRPAPPPRPPRRPRPAPRPTPPDVGPVSSPAQVEQSASPPPPADEPVTSPAQVEQPAIRPPATIDRPASDSWEEHRATIDDSPEANAARADRHLTGTAYYDARASRLIASIPKRVARTRELIGQWPTFLDRYRGGLPRGVFAAVMQMESDGHRVAKGDSRLGEVGLFQITEEFPRSLGLDPRLRYDTEWNFYFAGTEYNHAAARWARRYRSLIENGSRDAWLLARVSFAIGDGGARGHVERALQAHRDVAQRDGVYAALSTFVREGGARKAGSQSAAKVAYRIAVVCPVNFEIGEKAEPGPYGLPVKLSPPSGRKPPR